MGFISNSVVAQNYQNGKHNRKNSNGIKKSIDEKTQATSQHFSTKFWK